MKIEETLEGFNIFINNIYLKDINWDNKSSIEDVIRNLFYKIKKYYKISLKGFYKVKIYPSNIGVFIETIKLDDDNYDGVDIDFRILVIFNRDMYLKMDDYYFLNNDNMFFYNNNYYLNVDFIDNYLRISDYGEIVFGDSIDFSKCIYINKKDYL